jgi:MFS transporter, SP family, general alpha glucoside:H+ symporter
MNLRYRRPRGSQPRRIYRKGAFWSIFFSLSIIMRAYDIEITGNFFALPSFNEHFGRPVPGHGYQIPANWQVAMSMGSLVGQIIGAYIVAWPMEKIGRRKTLALYLLLTSALVFMQVFAKNIEVLTTSMCESNPSMTP